MATISLGDFTQKLDGDAGLKAQFATDLAALLAKYDVHQGDITPRVGPGNDPDPLVVTTETGSTKSKTFIIW